MKNPSLIFLCLLFFNYAGFTQVAAEITDQNWHIIPSFSNQGNTEVFASTEPYKQSAGDVEGSKIYFGNNEVIALVGYKKDEYGVIKLNNKLQVKWNAPIKGIPVKIAKFKDLIVVITNASHKLLGGFSANYNALLMNPETGKILRTKAFTGLNITKKLPRFFTSEKGSFFFIGVPGEKDNNNQLLLYAINEQLELQKQSTIHTGPSTTLIHSINDQSGNFYVSGYPDETTLEITYFSQNGEKKGLLTIPFQAHRKTSQTGELFASSTPGKIYVTINYLNEDKDKTYGFFIADFSKNKTTSRNITLSKSYLKEKKSSYKEVNSELNDLHTNDWNYLKTRQVFENGNNILVWREVYDYSMNYIPNSSASRSDSYLTSDAWLTTYSNEGKEVSSLVIPKYNQMNVPMSYGTSLHLKDEKLYFVSANKKKRTNDAVLGVFDIASQTLTKYELFSKQTKARDYIIEPKSTLWFDESYIIHFLQSDGAITIKNITTDLQKLNY